jgi:hypothetical protein
VELFELINELRGQGQPDEISLRTLATMSGENPPRASWQRWASAPKERITQPWGASASMRQPIEPEAIVGIARTLRVPQRTVGLAVLESCGLEGMFTDGLDVAAAKMPARWWTLTDSRIRHLRRTAEYLMADQENEDEATALRAEVDELRARVAELEASQPRRRKT